MDGGDWCSGGKFVYGGSTVWVSDLEDEMIKGWTIKEWEAKNEGFCCVWLLPGPKAVGPFSHSLP